MNSIALMIFLFVIVVGYLYMCWNSIKKINSNAKKRIDGRVKEHNRYVRLMTLTPWIKK